ncbi:hypothetical protein KAH81_06150 [bacterium]|nr:hypothetical protein [bacterium]
MTTTRLISIFVVIVVGSVLAVFEVPPPDPAAIGMADISPAIGPGPTSLFYKGEITAGGGYIRSFNYSDFDQLSAWASWSHEKIGRFSAVLGGQSVGDLSTETSIGFAYTRPVFSDIHTEFNLAVRGSFYSLSYGKSIGGMDLGSGAGAAFDMAGEAVIYKRTKVSIFAENLTATNLGVEGDIEIPRAVTASIGYSPYNATDMVFHVRRESIAGYTYGLGISFSPHEIVTFRFGAVTNPDRVTAGVGLKYKFARFDYALKSHPALPLSHAASIGIDFGQ